MNSEQYKKLFDIGKMNESHKLNLKLFNKQKNNFCESGRVKGDRITFKFKGIERTYSVYCDLDNFRVVMDGGCTDYGGDLYYEWFCCWRDQPCDNCNEDEGCECGKVWNGRVCLGDFSRYVINAIEKGNLMYLTQLVLNYATKNHNRGKMI